MVYVIQVCWQLCDIYHCCVYSEKTPDDGQRNCPKHVEFYSKNKFEKLVHLVGFVIRIYHDARSPERQIYHSNGQNVRRHRTTVQNLVARTISAPDICTPLYELYPHPISHTYHRVLRSLTLLWLRLNFMFLPKNHHVNKSCKFFSTHFFKI